MYYETIIKNATDDDFFEKYKLKRTEMKQVQIERETLFEALKAKGHKCVVILESYPIKVSWCGHEPCENKHHDSDKDSST